MATKRGLALYFRSEEEKGDFKHTLTEFLRAYSFLNQIIPYQDIEIEKFYSYGKLLLIKLPKAHLFDRFNLVGKEVSSEY